MLADVLRQDANNDPNVALSQQGQHEVHQDPRTGVITRRWVPVVDDTQQNKLFSIDCLVSGIIDGGIRVAGTTERFDKTYENADFAHMVFPSRFHLSKRDRITNVRMKNTGVIFWVEEELDFVNGAYPATVFNVLGITPMVVPFVGHSENRALLARADLDAA